MTIHGEGARRRLLGSLAAVVLAVGVVAGGVVSSAAAADPRDLDRGFLISDELFYDSNAMTAAEVQSFLNMQVPTCRTTAAPGCLKSYVISSDARTANANCAAIAAGTRTAAQAIDVVARACGISQKVLLVLLQKEQSLVTSTAPSQPQYNAATGYGCPDSSACDSRYRGLFNQLYNAAWQFKQYAANPNGFRHHAGQWNSILTSTYSDCDPVDVYIVNQATASLYNYTPYTPDDAAIADLYGSGDHCSSYGNRNFWRLYTDWFGSATYRLEGAIRDYYFSIGGATSYLGSPTGAMRAFADGWSQLFKTGGLYIQRDHPVYAVKGAIGERYRALGENLSALGWPVGAEVTVTGGWTQSFQHGVVYSSAFGTQAVLDPISSSYTEVGAQHSTWGWPIGPDTPVGEGSYQEFENILVGQVDGGVHLVSGDMLTAYRAAGGPAAGLGLPIADAVTVDGVLSQAFTGGYLVLRQGEPVLAVSGAIGQAFVSLGGPEGAAGYPVARMETVSGGWYQKFENGTIYSSAQGTWFVASELDGAYSDRGRYAGALGWPRAAATGSSGALAQVFQGGALVESSAGVFSVEGSIGALYMSKGGVGSSLGRPVARMETVSGGWYQEFERGAIFCSASGVLIVPSGVYSEYQRLGRQAGVLGWPTSSLIGATRVQNFQHGVIVSGSASGSGSAFAVKGSILGVYGPTGGTGGYLGYPISAERESAPGWSQTFQAGQIQAGRTRAPYIIKGAIWERYLQLGETESIIGWATSAEQTIPGGWQQTFEKGAIFSSSAGTWRVQGSILDTYRAAGGATGELGFPAGDQLTPTGGWSQAFGHAVIYAEAGGGTYVVKGEILRAFLARGASGGALGWPTGPETWTGQGWWQQFEHGRVSVSTSGVVTVSSGSS